jgi:hypothetical protein
MEEGQKGPRPHHDEPFKRSAVELLVVSGKPIKQVAAEAPQLSPLQVTCGLRQPTQLKQPMLPRLST